MRHLFLLPVYNCAHILPLYFANLRELDPKPDYIVFIENNSTDATVPLVQSYRDIPSELIQMNFPKDQVKRHGAWEHFAILCQILWERARKLNPEYVWRVDCDVFVQSTNALDALADWDVDLVSATIMRNFPNGLHISAKWATRNPKIFTMKRPRALLRRLSGGSLIVARSIARPRVLLDSTPLMVGGGFTCIRNRLLQDKRVNWHPIYRPKGVPKKEKISEDYAFCYAARDAGYSVCLDETVICDHVVWDARTSLKPWTASPDGVEEGIRGFEF